jgi:hypothetical protein
MLVDPRLLVPVGDTTFGQVVRGEFEGDPVARHDLDAVAAKPAGHGRQHWHACVEFDRKHPGPEFFDYFTHHFYRVFFWQIISPFRFPLNLQSS